MALAKAPKQKVVSKSGGSQTKRPKIKMGKPPFPGSPGLAGTTPTTKKASR